MDRIEEWWKGYFDQLINDENPGCFFRDVVPNRGISRNEVKVTNEEGKGDGNGLDSGPFPVHRAGVEVVGSKD